MSISCHGQPHFNGQGSRERSIYLTLFHCGNISNLELREREGKRHFHHAKHSYHLKQFNLLCIHFQNTLLVAYISSINCIISILLIVVSRYVYSISSIIVL